MKGRFVNFGVINTAIVGALILFGLATEAATTPADPCIPIRKACLAAGYKMPKQGASKTEIQTLRTQGIDLTANCLRPILHGTASTVARLQVSPSWQIQQCKAEIDQQVKALTKSGTRKSGSH